MSEIKYGSKMEDMQGDELLARVKLGWNFETPPLTPMPYIGKIKQKVRYQYNELVGLCPVTGILDLYELGITFIPGKWVPELKTLKMYLLSFKDLPISHEHLQAKIYKEFKEQVKPKWLKVELSVAVRGGIKTDIVYED